MPTPDATALVLESLLRQVFRAEQDPWMVAFAELDLTFNQVRMLMVLEHCDEAQPISNLATFLGLTLPSAGRNVERLVKLGLVDRTEDPSDRRVKRVGLTEQGAGLVALKVEGHRSTLRTFASALTDDERERLVSAVEPLLRPEEDQHCQAPSDARSTSRPTSEKDSA